MKKKKTNKILLSIGIIIVIVLIFLLLSINGTIFKETKVKDNKSIDYSNQLMKEVYDKNENSLISDLTLNTNLAFFYSLGTDNVKAELNNYFNTDSDTLISNYNNIYKRYKFAGKRVAYGSSLWVDSNGAGLSKESEEIAKQLNFNIISKKFNDKTLKQMNNWIKKKSHGKVKNAIDDIKGAHSVLLSTLYFNEKWNEAYESEDIKDGLFHGVHGNTQVSYLNSEENIYLESDKAEGFMKPYKDNGLYFIGILPKDEYSITDINLEELMKNKNDTKVNVSIPEFEYEQTIDMDDVLKNMTINSIFEPGNLDKIAKDLYIDRIIQKNYIKVDRKGTEAFSANITITKEWSSISGYRSIVLDRPFIFMIYDDTIDQVLFIGNVNDIKQK